MSNEMYEDIDGTLNLANDAGIQETTETTEGTASETATETHEEGTETAGAENGAEGTEQTEEEKAAAAEEHKKKTGSQRARERADRLERENQALRDALARGNSQTQPPPEVKPEAPQSGKPDPNDPKWKSHEEFQQAQLDYEVERRLTEREQRSRVQAQQETWKQREEAVIAKHEDYPEAFRDFMSARPAEPLKQALLRHPEGPSIVHFLGNNLQELRRISALDPVDQVLEVGELGSRFKAPPKKEPKQTQAPAPIKPLGGASKPVVRTESTDAYEQY